MRFFGLLLIYLVMDRHHIEFNMMLVIAFLMIIFD